VDVPRPHEAALLELDIAKARSRLGWQPVWSLDDAIDATSDWYRAFLANRRVKSREQLAGYVARARASRAAWAS
jgi:CDP-glucose 4,6-dehydratase